MEVRETKRNSGSNPFLIFLASIGAISLVFFTILIIFFFSIINMFKGFTPQMSSITSSSMGIGVIEIKEIISDVEPILKNIREFRYKDNIKAVIIRIDSPGGAVGASQELYEEIKKLDKEKPVVASLVNVAASGGYYAALGARKIVANPGTVTGSIGVIMRLPNLERLFEKIGIKETVIKSGEMKDMTSISREITYEEKQIMEESLKDVHEQFMKAVSESRKIPYEEVVKLSDGRIFTGKKALELKMIDAIGNFSDAIEIASEYAGLKGKPELIYPPKKDFIIGKYFIEETLKILHSQLAKEQGTNNLYYLPQRR